MSLAEWANHQPKHIPQPPPSEPPPGYRFLDYGEAITEDCLIWTTVWDTRWVGGPVGGVGGYSRQQVEGWMYVPEMVGRVVTRWSECMPIDMRGFVIAPRNSLVAPEPVVNDRPAVWELVIQDMATRDEFGRQKYGIRLQPHNGRDALTDLYQELLDAVVYARQLIFEREGK